MGENKKREEGFSLIELLIYIAIFVTSSTFLVAILTSVTKVQVRQGSVNAVNRQIRFVNEFLERKVAESSVIDMAPGETKSEIVLRMSQAESDPTAVYLENGRLWVREGEGPPRALTEGNVVVENFKATKLENPGGKAILETAIGISYDTPNEKTKFSRVVESAMTRISAASFDSDLVPTGANLNVGTQAQNWRDGYFSGIVGIGATPGAGAKLGVGGNMELTGAGNGIFLRSPNGTCYKVIVTDLGGVTTGSCN